MKNTSRDARYRVTMLSHLLPPLATIFVAAWKLVMIILHGCNHMWRHDLPPYALIILPAICVLCGTVALICDCVGIKKKDKKSKETVLLILSILYIIGGVLLFIFA